MISKNKETQIKMNKQYDVLLTYPAENVRLFESMIPLGIASIAAVLEENSFSVKIVDFNHYKGDYRRDLAIWQPKIIGIGGTTPTRAGSFLTARLSKITLPHIPVVYGGIHASFTARDTLEHITHIDYIVKGEAEFTFLSLCKHFVNKEPINIFSLEGLCYRENQTIIENKHARIQNLETIPNPARHLFNYSYTMTMDFFNIKSDYIMTSRGCPAGCSFCSASRMFPGGVRLRPMPHVKNEIDKLLSTKDIEGLKIFDSTFTANRNHVLEFCNMIRPYKILWECEIRADTVDLSLLSQMKNAGCCYINMGLETINEKLLERIGKNIKVKQVEDVLVWCRKLDIKTKVFFTFGHIGQTYNDCREDIFYIHKNKKAIDFYATTIGMRVYPGTLLEKRLVKNSIIPKGFSWATYKSPLKNWILLEPSDVMLLDQKQLSLFRLAKIIPLLFLQGTVLSTGYIFKMIQTNITGVFSLIRSNIRHTKHRLIRIYIRVAIFLK